MTHEEWLATFSPKQQAVRAAQKAILDGEPSSVVQPLVDKVAAFGDEGAVYSLHRTAEEREQPELLDPAQP